MPDAVVAVREFSRFYTRVLGLLGGALLASPYSLTEVRVLFELAQPGSADSAGGVGTLDLRQRLGLDAGYLSRILARFEAAGLVERERSAVDGRRQLLRLTAHGREVFADLDTRSTAQVAGLLADASEADRRALVGALGTVRAVLGDGRLPIGRPERVRSEPASPAASASAQLRPVRPGDLGWVVQRHGLRYAEEYGWDSTFEGMVARIAGEYTASPHASRQNAWIAELHGEPVGSIFCTRKDDDVAQLRLLLVEPAARGAGVGTALVAECLRFAASAGYREIMLWTTGNLHAARRIYERAGFRLEHEAPMRNFGADLTEQVWRRPLP
jgi:DNA-binding MarR family transcriptional regulator/GNAT superfamily N-acetyltransferase